MGAVISRRPHFKRMLVPLVLISCPPSSASPDGGKVAFSSNRKAGFPQLYRKAPNGEGNDELLLNSNTTDRPDDWSPDGQFILYEPNPNMAELWLLPLSGDHKPTVFLG